MLIQIRRHLMIWKAEGREAIHMMSFFGNATKPQAKTMSTNEHILQTKQPAKPTESKNLHNTRYSLRSILPKGARSLRGPKMAITLFPIQGIRKSPKNWL